MTKMICIYDKYNISECLSMSEKAWFIKYFQQLAQMGIPSLKKEKLHFKFVSIYIIYYIVYIV